MKKNTLYIIIIVFFLSSVNRDSYAEWKKKVLVLHSYHQGLEWTDNITKGIKSVFLPFRKDYEIHFEYLDTKRNTGKYYMEQVVRLILAKNKHIKYRVVILSDNTALKLVNEGRIFFPGNPPIVFCGINNFSNKMISGIKNATGVVEVTDYQATIDVMRKLHPDRNRVIVILDRTPTGNSIREEFKKIELLYKGKIEFQFLRDFLLEEVPHRIARFGKNDLIYLLTFNRDKKNNFISYNEGIEIISSNSQVPVYGSWDFYLGKGIIGGRITSGYLQGRMAGNLALKILHGNSIGELKIVSDCPTQYMFDYKYMKKFYIAISSLPKNSVVINSPPEKFEKYRKYLIAITVISLCIALFLFWKYKKQESVLEAKRKLAAELEEKVRKRTRDLETANRELQRLSNLDGLTQLYNRRYFDEKLKEEVSRLRRTLTPIALLMCDIDYFKKFNDTYGHVAGDRCIRSVADSLRNHCKRVTDIPARYGGEEFAVIMPNTGASEAASIAESIRLEIERKKIPHESSPVKEIVSISIGFTSIVPDETIDPSRIISLADKALFESKNNGRDRVTFKNE